MQHTAPAHPSKLTGSARDVYRLNSRKATSLDALRKAQAGDVMKLAVDYAIAHSLLVTGRVPRRDSTEQKRVELTLVVTRVQTFDVDHKIFGRVRGSSIAVEIRLTATGKIRQIVVGNPDEPGGMLETWILGQVGDLLSASKIADAPASPAPDYI